jgi:cell division protein WhiA
MSFISEARKEMIELISSEKCCVKAFLFGVYKGSGYIALRKNQWWLGFRFTDEELLNKCFDLIHSITDIEPTITGETGFGGRNTFQSFILELDCLQSKIIAELLSIDFQGVSDIDKQIEIDNFQSECCRKALLKGLFLSAGTMSLPTDSKDISPDKKSGGYYLEIKVYSEQLAMDIACLLKSFGIPSKIRNRRMSFSVYLKDSELISDFLAATGAYNSLFKLQELIVLRSMKNDTNRGLNCNLANINRSIGAAATQSKAIKLIIEKKGLDSLDQELRQTALARLDYPEFTLAELASHLGNVSKSCINHRLRKLIALSESLITEK